jgi:response regulator of citrate/malate metabolism
MIRTLIVDDDHATAAVHRSYVERVSGFEAVAVAHSGEEALDLAGRLHPDLVLLDIYMPDLSGLEVLRRLRELSLPRVDVIAITAANDVDTLRAAIHGGVIHYLVKPFFFESLRDRLDAYATLRGRLDRLHEPTQSDIDHVFSLLRKGRKSLPKGISAPTLALVVEGLTSAEGEVTAADIAERAGVSRGTSRRYLEYLVATGATEMSLRYGATGRPEHLYRWAEPAPREGDAGSRR